MTKYIRYHDLLQSKYHMQQKKKRIDQTKVHFFIVQINLARASHGPIRRHVK